ncbi:hypothetical protein J6590_030482 [Homalodisca vitripennis]|nr:hypothetical protein J6590_030482 [Homalodisca vitripennis]
MWSDPVSYLPPLLPPPTVCKSRHIGYLAHYGVNSADAFRCQFYRSMSEWLARPAITSRQMIAVDTVQCQEWCTRSLVSAVNICGKQLAQSQIAMTRDSSSASINQQQ